MATVGQIRKKLFDFFNAVGIAFGDDVADTAFGSMGQSAAQFVMGNFLADDRLDYIGAGDIHEAASLDHENPVRQSGRIDSAARCRAHNRRNLGNITGRQGVAVKNSAVAFQ